MVKKKKITKSKALSIILAILFGPWTYLYTFKWDKIKFIVLLLLNIMIISLQTKITQLFIVIIRIYIIIDVAWRTKKSYINYNKINKPVKFK